METAYKICLELLSQRGYDIIDEESTRITALKPNGEQMCVFFVDAQKFNVKCVQEYQSLMNEIGIDHSIIVYEHNVTCFANKTIESTTNMKIELFSESDLQYNITKHRLQPKFECLTKEESEKFKATYGVKFGGMLTTDPIVKFYGFLKGDVIRIVRKNGYITYRIVK
jgi:DNA-directed RNA polymerase I, II, and III subunit RPABC1